ncbi:MAG: zinc ribbon domain-containing protein [Patescibacteria group bacterium]
MNEEQTKKCPKCQEEVLKSAKKCKHCGSDLRSWFMRHKIISAFLILIFISAVSGGGNSGKSNNVSTSDNNQQTSVEPSKPEEQKPVSKEILVINQVVKRVDGKCRYFFSVENKDQAAFSGSVTIKVINPITTVGTDTFTTKQPIEPSMSQIVYIDTNTCPPSIHGEAGTNKFEYEVKENGQTVKSGDGGIIDKITE